MTTLMAMKSRVPTVQILRHIQSNSVKSLFSTLQLGCQTLNSGCSSFPHKNKSFFNCLRKVRHLFCGGQDISTRNMSSAASCVPQLDLDYSDLEYAVTGEDATEKLKNLGPDDTRRLKIIKLEFDVIEQMYNKVPEVMTDERWLVALQLGSKTKRMRYYSYLKRVEKHGLSKRERQAVKQQERAERVQGLTAEEKGLTKNTIFLRLYDSTMKKAGNNRLVQAMQFGQQLVFDMDYEQHMRHQDCQNLVDQMLMTYGKNRDHPDPFNFIFTSLNPTGKVLPMLRKAKLTGQNFLGTMTDKSYLDLYPRERLVYLSPHSPNELQRVDPNDIYIVGGFNDKSCQKPISLARAKEQRIRTAKFPLDRYLMWGLGTKSLTLNQVMGILLTQRHTGSWEQALKFIPRRKLQRDY